MNKYESVIVMKSNIAEGDKVRIVTAIEEITESYLQIEDIGIRKLAYNIKGNEEGYYLLFRFECTIDRIAELERFYRLENNIIKFITIRIDEDEI